MQRIPIIKDMNAIIRQDINRMGWANFYARTLHEYFKYGFPKVYEIKNTLEWNADQYMDYRNKNPL